MRLGRDKLEAPATSSINPTTNISNYASSLANSHNVILRTRLGISSHSYQPYGILGSTWTSTAMVPAGCSEWVPLTGTPPPSSSSPELLLRLGSAPSCSLLDPTFISTFALLVLACLCDRLTSGVSSLNNRKRSAFRSSFGSIRLSECKLFHSGKIILSLELN